MPNEPSADNHYASPEPPAADAGGTGLPGLRSWGAVYWFVAGVFVLWVVLLRVLTRAYS